MVAGKVRMAMGLQKSPANPKQNTSPKPQSPSPSSAGKNSNSQKAVFSRSFGVYFPRSSAQVQPRPPDVAELLRLVEQLRDRESKLKTELLEFKLLKESVAIVPLLESEIGAKNAELDGAVKENDDLRSENEALKRNMEEMKREIEAEREERESKIREMEAEIAELEEVKREMAVERSERAKKLGEMEDEIAELRKSLEKSRAEIAAENEELSSSQRFQGLMEVSVKSNLIRNLKRSNSSRYTEISSNLENHRVENSNLKKEENECEMPRHSRCYSEELSELTLSTLKSRIPRIPKPPRDRRHKNRL